MLVKYGDDYKMDKIFALDVLENIKQDIQEDWTGNKALKTIKIYMKNLEVAVNPKIKELIEQQKETMAKYGEDDAHTIKLNKKISKELEKIFNS